MACASHFESFIHGMTRLGGCLTTALLSGVAYTIPISSLAAEDSPSVTPYRPSVSTPAALSAPGWVEIEVGGFHAHGPGRSRHDSLPYTLKLAFSEDWGVRIGGEGWIRQ